MANGAVASVPSLHPRAVDVVLSAVPPLPRHGPELARARQRAIALGDPRANVVVGAGVVDDAHPARHRACRCHHPVVDVGVGASVVALPDDAEVCRAVELAAHVGRDFVTQLSAADLELQAHRRRGDVARPTPDGCGDGALRPARGDHEEVGSARRNAAVDPDVRRVVDERAAAGDDVAVAVEGNGVNVGVGCTEDALPDDEVVVSDVGVSDVGLEQEKAARGHG